MFALLVVYTIGRCGFTGASRTHCILQKNVLRNFGKTGRFMQCDPKLCTEQSLDLQPALAARVMATLVVYDPCTRICLGALPHTMTCDL